MPGRYGCAPGGKTTKADHADKSLPRHAQWLFDPRLVVVILWALLIANVLIARVNWRADPLQRTGEHLTIWAMRLLIGSMWYQGSTWKLPLPYSDAFAHWLRQSGEHASFPLLADLVNRVMIPALPVVGTFVYLLEFAWPPR